VHALNDADYVICCDAAYNILCGQRPDIQKPITIIGDFDSIECLEFEDSRVRQIIHVYEQQSNDQTKAFNHALDMLKRQTQEERHTITILGATGKREDHTLGNIALLADYLEESRLLEIPISICMMTNYGCLTPIDRPTIFESFPRQQVSLFSMIYGCVISTDGLEYPLHGESLPRLWMGTLNASLGQSFSVTPEGGIVIVYQTFDPK